VAITNRDAGFGNSRAQRSTFNVNQPCFPYRTGPKSDPFAPILIGLINELALVCQRKFTRRITGLTMKASNSFDQECPEHLVSPTKTPTHPAIAPSSLPCRSESSVLIKGLLTETQARHGTGKEIQGNYRRRPMYVHVWYNSLCGLLIGAM
jgi:hypothetical protein